jgi:hypothetical protein
MNRTQMSEIRDQGPAVSSSSSFEETLRLLAHLPAPEGLEERVEAGLRAAPNTGKARILRWPVARRLENPWVRAAAAAAIVAVIVGGGWGVYSSVEMVQPARGIVVPQHVAAPGGGFSNAGAMRTPQTLNGPIVAPPAATKPAVVAPPAATPAVEPTSKPAIQPKATSSAKTGALPSQKPLHPAKAASAKKAVEPATPPADAQPAVIPAK